MLAELRSRQNLSKNDGFLVTTVSNYGRIEKTCREATVLASLESQIPWVRCPEPS
jgi:hypothetical protein